MEELVLVLEDFKSKKIAVIGDIMLDEYIIGSVHRISPEAPVPVLNVIQEKTVLGGAANVVANLRTMGTSVNVYSVIGNDNNGRRLKNNLIEIGSNVNGLFETDDRVTIVKRRVLAGHQQLLRMDWESKHGISSKFEEQLIKAIGKDINNIDAIIISDYAKGVLTENLVQQIISLAKRYNKIVGIDPKPENIKNYFGATFLTPNIKEARESIAKLEKDLPNLESIEEIGKILLENTELDHLLMTKSEKGLSIFENKKLFNIPTYAKEVYDVTGAGDTVISIYTLGLASGLSKENAAKIANTAAGIAVGKLGTATVSAEEIINFYNEIYHEFSK